MPAVEPDTRGATTIRQQLDKHRKLETCSACHAKIDPAGFALESFDVIGVAGNRRRAPRQISWAFLESRAWDERENLSGTLAHGDTRQSVCLSEMVGDEGFEPPTLSV